MRDMQIAMRAADRTPRLCMKGAKLVEDGTVRRRCQPVLAKNKDRRGARSIPKIASGAAGSGAGQRPSRDSPADRTHEPDDP